MLPNLLLIVATGILSAPTLTADTPQEAKVLLEWRFDQAGELKGWRPNSHLRHVEVSGGELRAEAFDWDPFLTSPLFEIPTSPWQWVEIELRCDTAGQGQLFWSGTLESPYEGFFPQKVTNFSVRGDGEWHTLRLFPFWQAEGKIVHLRLDLFQGARFGLRAIRVMEPAHAGPLKEERSWDFRRGTAGWTVVGASMGIRRTNHGIAVTVPDTQGFLRSPLLATPIGDRLWVAVRMRSLKGERASLVWVTDRASGLREMRFPLRSDGRFHTYNLDVGADPTWDGKLLALGIRPSYTPPDEVELQSISMERDAVGEPDLELLRFGLEDAINRVGKPCRL
ncbi:MAG: hypothetical protein QHJ73_15210, partial [Armatimonadota bacterium]|nr:hypothetical protein [Armatimonadota bacterium]